MEGRFCITTIAGLGVSLAGFSALLTLRAGQVWDAVALRGAPAIVRTSVLDEFKPGQHIRPGPADEGPSVS